jgi:hypothetical protein
MLDVNVGRDNKNNTYWSLKSGEEPETDEQRIRKFGQKR